MTSFELAKKITKILDDKKAEKIDVIEIADLTIISDYFVIASATNTTHVRALADEVDFQLKKENRIPANVEGYENANWIVMDYQDVVVHVFYEETRDYYKLEKLWADGKQLNTEDLLK